MSDDSGVPSPGMLGRLGPGSRVAGYVIEEKIGSGGMAVVFRARDETLGRLVALKVLAPALADDEEFRIRFLGESRSVAAVEEPHIVPVYAAGEADGVLYLATRFVAGGDLAALLKRAGGTLDPGRAAALIIQVASALDAAHAVGLVHRDVKPGNVLIDDAPGRSEHAYLSDFGLSKAVSSAPGLTASGVFLGTPDYCAPEQISGRPPVSARTDQYSLACVVFRLLTGSVPYQRGETLATLFAHLQAPVPSPTSIRPGLPGAVDPVLAKAMAKEPTERYGSCGEFASALQEAVHSPARPSMAAPADPPIASLAPEARAPVATGQAAVRDHPPTEAAPRFPTAVNSTALPPETMADTRAAEIPTPESALPGTFRGVTGTAAAKPARRRRRRIVPAAVAATILVAVAAWAGLTLSGSPGASAAAIAGNQRISVAALDSQVADLKTAAKPYSGKLDLASADMPRAVLSWLIRFAIQDQVDAGDGISVSQSQIEQGIASINAQAAQAASQAGVSSQVVLLDAGISPQMLPELGRYQAQETAYAEKVNGGKLSTTQAESNKVSATLSKAQCIAAKSLNIQVNAQYGRFDYASDSFEVVAPSPASTEGLVPAC
jgi:serine/threonine protein kinase